MEHLLTSPFLHFFPILQRLERIDFFTSKPRILSILWSKTIFHL
nr:MAG TPA: hypothetical protein [Caudoviricetes sp.]